MDLPQKCAGKSKEGSPCFAFAPKTQRHEKAAGSAPFICPKNMQEKINRTVGALDLPQRYAGKRKERGSRFAFAPKKKKMGLHGTHSSRGTIRSLLTQGEHYRQRVMRFVIVFANGHSCGLYLSRKIIMNGNLCGLHYNSCVERILFERNIDSNACGS